MFRHNYLKELIPDLLIGTGFALLLIGIFLLAKPAPASITVPDHNQSAASVAPELLDPELSSQILKPFVETELVITGVEEPVLEDFKLEFKPLKGVSMLEITIPEGSTGIEVARIFDQSGLIEYDKFLQLLILFRVETRIKAGTYQFPSNSEAIDILSTILLD